ncbi:TPA: RHS repeat-associated core domain-containing protein, partial [Neisseria subflava]
GNRIRTILPDGRHIDYLYYGSGHLHQISLDGEVITDIERDKLHREIQRTQGSISSLYDYDPMGRLKSQRTVWSSAQTPRDKQNPLAGGAVSRRYAYDKAGNLIQSADQRSGVLNYIYDKIGRIQEARNNQTGRSETFAFDPAHNILSDKAAEGKGNNLVSGNRLKEYNGIEYTYDALGNLIYRQLPNGENQYYQYDLENQLVRAEIKKPAGNTEIWTYAYDPFGRRLSKERQDKLAWTSTEPKRTHFVWDGSRLLQEYTYKGNYTYIYTDQDSYEPLAQVFDNAKDGKQYLAYFHNDQVGISREMTDIHGNLLWYGEYTAWGRLKKDERVYKNAHQPFRLQNQYFDEETGLHYNLMRYYEPEAGRFVNQDPIGLWGGANLYQFAPNANVWVDPLGLKVRVGNHGYLRKIKDGQQSHHLNQDAAFRSKIPREEGAAIKLKGNAFRDIGSDHYNVHKELEKFWDQYRRGGSKFGQVPTIGEYNKALENSLKQTSMSPQERCKALSSAKRNQRRYCLTEDDLVPRIPERINKKR